MKRPRQSKPYYVFHIVAGAKGVKKIEILYTDTEKLVEMLEPANFLNYFIRNFKFSHKLFLRAKEKIRLICWNYRDDMGRQPYI